MILSNPNSKLPYPKFLETTNAAIYIDGEQQWKGKCFLMKKARFSREQAGVLTEITAKVTISDDISHIELAQQNNTEISFKAGACQPFIVKGIRRINNPDNSFHHYGLELIEGAAE